MVLEDTPVELKEGEGEMATWWKSQKRLWGTSGLLYPITQLSACPPNTFHMSGRRAHGQWVSFLSSESLPFLCTGGFNGILGTFGPHEVYFWLTNVRKVSVQKRRVERKGRPSTKQAGTGGDKGRRPEAK